MATAGVLVAMLATWPATATASSSGASAPATLDAAWPGIVYTTVTGQKPPAA